MSAYLVVKVDVHDMEQYAEYMKHTPRVVHQYGGRFVARGAAPMTLEGEPDTLRNVVVEFPDADTAVRFYNSPEYGKCRALREGAATGQFVVLEGYPEDEWQSALAASQAESFD